MSTTDLPSRVDSIKNKVNKIMMMHQKVKDDIFKLEAEKDYLVKTLKERKTIIENLEEKNKRIKLAKSLSEDNESSLDVKLRINELVREIDKCIAYLNRQ